MNGEAIQTVAERNDPPQFFEKNFYILHFSMIIFCLPFMIYLHAGASFAQSPQRFSTFLIFSHPSRVHDAQRVHITQYVHRCDAGQ